MYRRTSTRGSCHVICELGISENQFRGYEIVSDNPEFTSMCPRTRLPDAGFITLRSMPREGCLELKSVQKYLFCYGNLVILQKNLVNQVPEGVVKASDPEWSEVRGDFRPRGGLSTIVTAHRLRPVDTR